MQSSTMGMGKLIFECGSHSEGKGQVRVDEHFQAAKRKMGAKHDPLDDRVTNIWMIAGDFPGLDPSR